MTLTDAHALTWRVEHNIGSTWILEDPCQWVQVVPLSSEQAALESLSFSRRL